MKGAIFDMDGTLLDSMPVWDTLASDYLWSQGIEPPEDIREIMRPLSLAQTARYFRETLGMRAGEEEIIADINGMIAHQYTDVVPLKAGVKPYLERLSHLGVHMCVATATDKALATAALERNGVLGYFEFVLSCGETGGGKDSPDFFTAALEKLGTDKDKTVVYEDALYAVKSAKQAGLYVVGVNDISAAADAEKISRAADEYYAAGFQNYSSDPAPGFPAVFTAGAKSE